MTDTSPAVGDKAPDFTLQASRGRTVSSSALAGHPYVLYFYPKADTPGCTTQACGIRDAQRTPGRLALPVIGISPDPVAKIDKFADKYELDFPLASDPDHKLADQYGTWVEKKMYGRTYHGMERSSFLIGADGRIKAIWRKVKPAEHAELIEKAAAAL